MSNPVASYFSSAKRNIQIVGAPDVDEIDAAKINSTIESTYDKISTILSNELLFVVHFKQHSSDGLRRKHSIKLRASVPGLNFVASSWDWKLITALQKTINSLMREVKSEIK